MMITLGNCFLMEKQKRKFLICSWSVVAMGKTVIGFIYHVGAGAGIPPSFS